MIKVITFRLDEAYLEKLEKIAKKLKLEDRSQVIRLFLDEGIAKHLQPGFRGEITAVNTKALDNILMALHNRIEELDPEEQAQIRAKKGAEAGEKVHELYKQGRKEEAKKLVKENIDKGIIPVYFEWEKL